jgi:hypothetical protein
MVVAKGHALLLPTLAALAVLATAALAALLLGHLASSMRKNRLPTLADVANALALDPLGDLLQAFAALGATFHETDSTLGHNNLQRKTVLEPRE